jgi:SNF1-activating kinase 1
VAIKIVQRFSKQRRLARLSTPEEKVKKEVAILKKARHPNVVALLEVIDDPSYKKVYIVLEFVELGEIVWRKQGLNAVIEVERRRLEREKKGIPETVESMESDQDFVRNAELRHIEHEKKRAFILAKEEELKGKGPAKKLNPSRVRSPSTASSQIVEPRSWSLELGGEPQDDDEAATGYDTPHAPTSQGLSTAPDDVDQSPSSVSSRRDLALAGSMYGPYSPDPYDERRISGGSSPISMHSDAWAPADEESAWVPCLTLSEIRSTFRDAVLGLEYLHFQGIIHRDLKPANLLWTADRRTKISDFGVSYLGRPIRNDDENGAAEEDATELHDPKELSRTVGTPAFYAPELCSTDPTEEPPKITGQIDVWALGVTLYCMVFGRVPFYDDNDYVMYQKICKEDVFISRKRLKAVDDPAPTPPGSQGQLARSMNSNKRLPYELVYEPIEDDLVNLLQRLLTKDPTSRITLKDVKRHPWVLGEIPNQSTWVEETDPSKQSAGKKIEVSDQDVAAAISKNNFIGRAMSTVKRLVMGAASSRNRATSTATSVGTEPKFLSSSSTLGKVGEGKGTSKPNEIIFTASLKASREGEHPLAQSVTASPELKEGTSYFVASPVANADAASTGATPKATDPKEVRPNALERSQSNAESVKTLKGPAPHILPNLMPSPNAPEPNPSVLDQFSSGFGGLLGKAGGRLTHSMKSKGGKRNASSDRSSSVSLSSVPDEDAHGEPSLAVSTAFASGQVNPPAALQEESAPPVSPERHSRISSISTHSRSPQNPYDSTPEAFTHAQAQLIRRQNLEGAATKTASRPQSAASFQDECPPSPDDEIFYRQEEEMHKRRQQPQETSMQKSPPSAATISSSDDQFSSGMSQSTSHPSIPSVVSGASSLSADDYLLLQDQPQLKSAPAPTAVPPMMRTGDTVKAVSSASVGRMDEDEAAWNGDNDDDDGSDEEDEGLSFGPSKGKKPLM